MGNLSQPRVIISSDIGGNDPDDPTAESWGGQFRKTGHGPAYWTDIHDTIEENIGSVNRWREQILNDWAERMNWCRRP